MDYVRAIEDDIPLLNVSVWQVVRVFSNGIKEIKRYGEYYKYCVKYSKEVW